MRRITRIHLIASVILLMVPIMIFVFSRIDTSIQYENVEIYSFPAEDVLPFTINDYQTEIEIFTSDETVDPITSLDDVVAKAQCLWNEEFSIVTATGLPGPNPGDGIEVFFDSENACWLIRGTIPADPLPPDVAGWLGALPNVIICENGDVLAMWQG